MKFDVKFVNFIDYYIKVIKTHCRSNNIAVIKKKKKTQFLMNIIRIYCSLMKFIQPPFYTKYTFYYFSNL